MNYKDRQHLEEAYASIFEKTLNEGEYVNLNKITDGGFGHGGHVASGPEFDDAPSRPRRSKKKEFPKYSKIATGKDYPQIDKWLHSWYNESPVAGGGGTYASMQGPIQDSDIRYWLGGDDEAIKFFIKNKVALTKAAQNMAS